MNSFVHEYGKLLLITLAVSICCFLGCESQKDADRSLVAETSGGRTVVLYENGTWEYAEEDSLISIAIDADTSKALIPKPEKQFIGTVKEVMDGDTYRVEIANPSYGIQDIEIVRLLGVDAPEMAPSEYYSIQAKEYARSKVLGNRVTISLDNRSRDTFCRLLAYIFLMDGTFLNLDMIEKGYARIFPRDDHRHYDDLVAAQELAMSEFRGIWDVPQENIQIIYIYNRGREEYIALANRSDKAIDISNWSIADKTGTHFTFPDGTFIKSGQIIKVFSGELKRAIARSDFYISSATIWNNDGDEAFLNDNEFSLITAYSYK